jgi:hypothetical protein
MTPRSKFVIVPPRKPALVAKRSTPKPQNRQVEHVVYGIGNLLHVRPLDDGSLVAVVECAGVDRTIRLAPDYFITPIAEIIKLAPHLAPPPAPKPMAKKAKASAVPDAGGEESELELGENVAEIDQDESDMVAEP